MAWVLQHGTPPENLVILETDDIDDMHSFCLWEKLDHAAFEEPDLDDQLTAVAFALEPGVWESFDAPCRRYLRELPLAFSR